MLADVPELYALNRHNLQISDVVPCSQVKIQLVHQLLPFLFSS